MEFKEFMRAYAESFNGKRRDIQKKLDKAFENKDLKKIVELTDRIEQIKFAQSEFYGCLGSYKTNK